MASVPQLGRDLANRLRPVNLTPMPIAADRSAELLAVADSLASVADKPANNMLYVPLIFTSYNMDNCDMQLPPLQPYTTLDQPTLNYDHRWLDDLQWNINFQNYHIQQMYVNHPNVVKYNLANMPEPPKQYEAVLDVKRNILTIEERKVEVPLAAPTTEVKQRNWIHAFDASLQFSQAYMSENWYQGGNNNLNMISNINYGLKLNQNLHPKLLYELTVQYKLGINSAPDDELRDTLVPINNRFSVAEVLDAARYYADKSGRRVSIEYALIRDINDQGWRADMLGKKLHKALGSRVHVNLIPLNPTPGSKWDASPKAQQDEFVRRVRAQGLPCTVRDTRGNEIAADCGQLAAEVA